MIKRVIVTFCAVLLGVMLLSLAGCGASDKAEGNSASGATVDATDATDLLTKVWNTYDDADKFPIGGGDFDNIVMDAPGKFDVTKADQLDSTLGFPQAQADAIDDASSIMHMMNANTFTAGAYRVTDASNVQVVADAVKESILNRQWMCGFPEKMIIASVSGENASYLVSAFGNGEMLDVFKTKLTEQFPMTEVIYEENIE